MIEDIENVSVEDSSVDNTGVINSEVKDVSNNTVDGNNNDTDNNGVDTGDKQSDGAGSSTVSDSNDNSSANNEQQGSIRDTNDQINFKALRQAKKQAERERDELAAKIKELNSINKSNVSEDDDVYEDDITKTRKDIQDLKRQWTAQQNQVKAQNIEQKLKAEFPDLESVVNEDNIEVLKARDPSFAKIINRAPSDPDELYHRAVAAYTLIKKYGIYVKDNHVKDRARVEKNMAKPRPASAASSSSSEGLSDFASFAGMNIEERRHAIFKLARERANS